jgi:hypothetical protein
MELTVKVIERKMMAIEEMKSKKSRVTDVSNLY